jgi:predicted dehydrogenase
VDFAPRFGALPEAMEAHRPGYVVVANRTREHYQTLQHLAAIEFGGIVLAEKPLFRRYRAVPKHSFEALCIAYNMRFLPVITRLREVLESEQIISVQAYAGQYLPTWRPQRPYQESYSARKSEGGGVLRDLSHELDYLNWLLGGWTSIAAIGGQYSHLELDSDDSVTMLLSFRRCPAATLQLNYLDRFRRRFMLVNTDRHTIEANIAQAFVQVDGDRYDLPVDADYTYRLQHRAMLAGRFEEVCSVEEGLDVMRMIEDAETSSATREWLEAES